ncbi:hypothetical protein MIR68_008570 [Amoeboaphelidium protococcarum]|nr:hypothetical protein MIR68_008570 [Amoeboaphelidium protococcarum]
MFLQEQEFNLAYNHIKQFIRSNANTALYIVSHADVDSVCGTRILTDMLVADLLSFKVVYVDGIKEFSKLCDSVLCPLSENVAAVCIFLVGFGATIDIAEFLPINSNTVQDDSQDQDQCKFTIFIADTHRPMNLDNLFSTDDVIVLDESVGLFETELKQVKDAYDLIQRTDGDGDDEDESSHAGSRGEDDNQSDADDDNYEAKQEKQLEWKHAARLLDDYYFSSGDVDGELNQKPVSMIMYEMASQMNKNNNTSLWTAIIGSTAFYFNSIVHNAASIGDGYNTVATLLKDEVSRLNSNSTREYSSSALVDPSALNADDQTIYYKRKNSVLRLYRYQSLFMSMVTTPMFMAKFALWKERGRSKLDNYVVSLGLSKAEVNSHWGTGFSGISLQELEDRLEEKAAAFGILDMWYSSFVKRFGYKFVISAVDEVEALNSLLQYGQSDVKRGSFMAFDALSNSKLLMHGVEMAKSFNQLITSMAISVIEEKAVKTLRSFRLCVLHENQFSTLFPQHLHESIPNDLTLFRNVYAIRQLGLTLISAMRETVKTITPLVICCWNEKMQRYLVVGISVPQVESQSKTPKDRLRFDVAFNQTIQILKISASKDSFDGDSVEIEKPDLPRFVEQLQRFLV